MTDKFTPISEVSERYIEVSQEALSKIKVAPPQRSFHRKAAEDFLEMAKAYFSDAKHFHENGDHARALAAVNYAHGWLDAGARLGLFDVGEDDPSGPQQDESDDELREKEQARAFSLRCKMNRRMKVPRFIVLISFAISSQEILSAMAVPSSHSGYKVKPENHQLSPWKLTKTLNRCV